jgi:hypothetical protein
MHPTVGGEPIVLGPYDKVDSEQLLPTFRTIGHRKTNEVNPPIAHAKLALLGRFWWHDEGPLGHVEDVLGFRAIRLWVSSANFTVASRKSLEFGYWTEDAALLEGARRFLLRLIGASEDFDARSDIPAPQLAEAELDMDAMADAAAELMWDEEEEA